MKQIFLFNRPDKFFIVDDEDYELMSRFKWNWSAGPKQGSPGFVSAVTTPAKMILGKHIAEQGLQIDHMDGDVLNCQKDNLRPCTRQENQRNSRSKNGSSSRYKGVSWNKQSKNWQVYLNNPKQIYLGKYDDEDEAARAYNVAAREQFGKFAKLNEIEVRDA